MTTRTDCAQAELLAGAIALGEADEPQRTTYRAHLAVCRRCCLELGGEREIERVMALPPQARNAERWAPDVRNLRRRGRNFGVAAKSAAILATAAIVIFGFRAVQHHPTAATSRAPAPSVSAQEERAIAALNTESAPRREHQAESLVFGGVSTMKLEVSVDAHGIPKRCTIVKSSDYRMLDQAVCRAALRTKP
jgi:hypothetical protein